MTFKPKALRIEAPMSFVDWTKLPVGTTFQYYSERRKRQSGPMIVRKIGSGGALWVTKPRAVSRGLWLDKGGKTHAGSLIPQTIVLPPNTKKVLEAGADFSWLMPGTLIQNGYGTWRCITGNDGVHIYSRRCELDDKGDALGLKKEIVTLHRVGVKDAATRRQNVDLRTETAVFPEFGCSGDGVWRFEAGIAFPPERPHVLSSNTADFLSWEAVL